MTAPRAVQQWADGRGQRWADTLRRLKDCADLPRGFAVHGVLSRMIGTTLEASGCEAAVGSRCVVVDHDGREAEAEVVGFSGDSLLMMPTEHLHGMIPGAKVIPSGKVFEARVGNEILGRVVDGAGRAIDDGGPLTCESRIRLLPQSINPLERRPIREPLDVGVRSINALFSVGRGQRMGLFAASGIGKSMLLGMMTRFTSADVIVVGLIGERGREVQEFVSQTLDAQSRRRAVVVASPADRPPLDRLHGALLATSIAEHFRDQGKHVLLLMDSLTRFAQAQREIALAIGEPPVTRGYPVSAFTKLPQLVERAGNAGTRGGSITAFYTVLTESNDPNDPIADAARAVLDGHIVLSKQLAESGHYPAVDVEASISRAAHAITTPEQQRLARRFRELNGLYAQNRDLIAVGAYAKGRDARADEAVERWPDMLRFLQQSSSEAVPFDRSLAALEQLFRGGPAAVDVKA